MRLERKSNSSQELLHVNQFFVFIVPTRLFKNIQLELSSSQQEAAPGPEVSAGARGMVATVAQAPPGAELRGPRQAAASILACSAEARVGPAPPAPQLRFQKAVPGTGRRTAAAWRGAGTAARAQSVAPGKPTPPAAGARTRALGASPPGEWGRATTRERSRRTCGQTPRLTGVCVAGIRCFIFLPIISLNWVYDTVTSHVVFDHSVRTTENADGNNNCQEFPAPIDFKTWDIFNTPSGREI